jgi:hypothetical protein
MCPLTAAVSQISRMSVSSAKMVAEAEVGLGQRNEQRQRLARIRLLNDELDRLRIAAFERTRSIDTKTSFVVVAAGVLASATFDNLVTGATSFVGLLPFGLTVATVWAAAVALWPTAIKQPTGQALVKRWVDACETPEQLEDYLLEMKAHEIQLRNENNERRSGALKSGFRLLIAALVTAFLVAGLNMALVGGNNGKTDPTQIQTPTPTPTAGAPGR